MHLSYTRPDQQSQTAKCEKAIAVEVKDGVFLRPLEEPMREVIFASMSTLVLFGVVLFGIWFGHAAINRG